MFDKNALVIQAEYVEPFPEDLLATLGFTVTTKVYLHEVSAGYRTDLYDIVLYSCDVLNENQLSWLLPLAQTNHNSQFLILARQISIHAYRQVSMMNNFVTMQTPCSELLLKGVIGELLSHKTVDDQKKFPRFITDEPVRMVVMETGLLIPTRMRNYSMSGAYLEYKGISLRVGHTLKVNLVNQENAKQKNSLQLNAKVVWVREDSGRSGSSSGVGVQFLDIEENT